MLKRKDGAKGDGAIATQFGRYRVLSALGQGAMASVHLAEDPSLNRMVAVKVIHSHLASIGNLLDRFTVEAQTAAALRNPNIVEIFDYGLQDGAQYLVMEYIDGPNLQFLLNLMNGKPLKPEACAAVICQAAEGLMVAEKHNVVHRDIKPENMMFSSEGVLKIADFGIAHINEQNLTQTGSILGSPSFMSPEQIEGGKPTPQTDMFSLGSVFYYCLTGKKPFIGGNIPTIMRNICDLPHPPVVQIRPDADPALVALVDTLLQKKPEDRGKGARWLSLQLRSYLNQKGVLDLQECCKNFIHEATANSDRTMVETAPKAPPMKPGQAMGGKASPPKTGLARPVSGVSRPFKPPASGSSGFKNLISSPLVLAGGGVGILAVITAGIWISVLTDKQPEPPKPPEPKVVETPKLASLAVDPAQIDLTPGQNRFLRALGTPPEALGAVSWRSSDTNVVVVKDGEARAKKAGKAQIQAYSAASPAISGICEVSVIGPVKPVVIPSPGTKSPVAALPPKPVVAEKVLLTVISAPPFAEVFLDGKYLGTTPVKKAPVTAGRHRIQVSHQSFLPDDTVVTLKAAEEQVKFRLLADEGP